MTSIWGWFGARGQSVVGEGDTLNRTGRAPPQRWPRGTNDQEGAADGCADSVPRMSTPTTAFQPWVIRFEAAFS